MPIAITKFRDAVESDAQSLAHLFSVLLNKSFDANTIIAFIADRSLHQHDGVRLFVIEVDEVVIASCQVIIYSNALRRPKKKAIIDSFVVAPEARGNGYGRLLLLNAIKFINNYGVEIISLVTGHQRIEAHSLYESVGFVNFGRGYTLNLASHS